MSEEQKPVSKIIGKIDLEKNAPEKKRHESTPLKQNFGELLKQAMEKAKSRAG